MKKQTDPTKIEVDQRCLYELWNDINQLTIQVNNLKMKFIHLINSPPKDDSDKAEEFELIKPVKKRKR